MTSLIAGAAALACLVAVVFVAAGSSSPAERLNHAILELLVVVPPLAAGLYAARFPRHLRFGRLLLGAALIWSFAGLGESDESLPFSLGRVAAWLIHPLLIYLILAFPAGRLRPGLDTRLFGGCALLVALLFVGSAAFVEAYPAQTPWASCGTDCPPNAFLVLDHEPAVMTDLVEPLREALASLLLAGVAASLAVRMRTASPLARQTNDPVMVMSIVSVVVLIAFLAARRTQPGAPAVETLGVLWSLCIPGLAAAFLVGLLRRRVHVGDVLQRLSRELGARPEGPRLREALASALSDPSLELLLPDADGSLVPQPAAGRAVMLIGDAAAPRAALVHDAALREDQELLDAVGALVVSTLEFGHLEHELAGSLRRLERSRTRIARAADLERSRIERDLHDGAQQRLIMLRIRLSLADDLLQSDPAAGAAAVRALGAEVDITLEELRSLAHGVYPSILSDRGLTDALRSVVAGSPVPIHLDHGGVHRHPPEVETAVYFACLEAIQNAIKHARGASGVWISLTDDNDALRFEVRDDGPGFAPQEGNGTGGVRNMRDRLEAVGGRLIVDSSPGHGTRVRGRVPLA